MLRRLVLARYIICCPRRPWLCLADWFTGCKARAVCDAHDRHITDLPTIGADDA
jgi:hypothetical protein